MDIPFAPLLLAGLVAAGVGGWFFWQGRKRSGSAAEFTTRAVVAQAEVIGLRLQHAPDPDIDESFWTPVVRFSLPDGRVVESQTMTGSRPAPAKVGEVVPVRYDPADPIRVNLATGPAQPGTFGALWSVLGGLGVLFGLGLVGVWALLAFVLGLPG